MVAFFSKNLSSSEQNYFDKDRELLSLVKFLERFRRYLERPTFEVITDSPALKHFFSRSKLNSKEVRWLETIWNFGFFHITLNLEKIHVLEEAL